MLAEYNYVTALSLILMGKKLHSSVTSCCFCNLEKSQQRLWATLNKMNISSPKIHFHGRARYFDVLACDNLIS